MIFYLSLFRPKWHVYNWARKFCIRSHGYVDFNLTVALTPFNVQETMIMTSVALTAHNRICNLYVRVAVANLMSLFAQNKPHKNTYRNLNTCIVWFRCKLLGEQLQVDLRSSGWNCGVNTLWRHSEIRVYMVSARCFFTMPVVLLLLDLFICHLHVHCLGICLPCLDTGL